MAKRDIVVIGTSMGGKEALQTLVAGLPGALPASIFVVRHVGADAPGTFPRMLEEAGPLPAKNAADGEPIRAGHIYVAPPDRHLLLEDEHVAISRGPKENRSRPAIDPLFRSAAVAHGSRVIGIILTGLLDDGASGLAAVKQCGGLAIVQSPQEAAYSDMPQHALEAVEADQVLPVAEMPALIAELVRQEAPAAPPVPERLKLEARIARRGGRTHVDPDFPGTPSPFACPDCGGVLREVDDPSVLRYRCHTGHAYTANALLQEQDESVEKALWVALRMLEERTAMLERLARRERSNEYLVSRFTERMDEMRRHAETLQALLLGTGRNGE